MSRKSRAIWTLILLLLCAAVMGIDAWDKFVGSRKICAWSHEPILRGKVPVQYDPERWVSRDAWAELDLLTWKEGNKFSGAKMKAVNKEIDERWK